MARAADDADTVEQFFGLGGEFILVFVDHGFDACVDDHLSAEKAGAEGAVKSRVFHTDAVVSGLDDGVLFGVVTDAVT